MTRSFLKSALLAAVLIAAPTLALADGKSEIATAADHAGYAAGANTIDAVHAHLHHTVNCLAGPGGTGFDATQMNPCAGAGKGAIADAADAAVKQTLEKASVSARAGLAAQDLAAAKADAKSAEQTLRGIP